MNTRCQIRRACAILGVLAALGACARDHGHPEPEAEQDASSPSSEPDAAGRIGSKAEAKLEPLGPARADMDPDFSVVHATATFVQTSAGVDLMVEPRNCVARSKHPLMILEGGDCSEATLLGARWKRGEGVPAVQCIGHIGMMGRLFYTREKRGEAAWTVGAPAASNVIGHALVAYDSTGSTPVACGVIEPVAAEPIDAEPVTGLGAKPEVRAQIAGLCLGKMIVRDNAQECPNPVELARCAEVHCPLDACVRACEDHIACFAGASDPCAEASVCSVSQECAECQGRVTQCVIGFCPEQVFCAAPTTPDGPCAKLEACCAMQGDRAEMCLELVQAVKRLSGDPSCFGVMHDWDSTAHLAVQCNFD